MSLVMVLITAITSLIVSILFMVIFNSLLSSLKKKWSIVESQQQVSELLISEMKLSIETLKNTSKEQISNQNNKRVETEQVVKQLEYRIGLLQSDVVSLQEQVKQSLEQPEDKLYSRAFKLLAKGADIEEIITECELPRAEAEMLFSMYKSDQS